jgi:hypothetical protein
MKHITFHRSYLILTIILSLVFGEQLHAQSITETLQKQIWAPTFTLADWENRLPDASQDTLFSTDGQFAEHIVLDPLGYPASVTTLARVDQAWLPLSRTQATMGAYGQLTGLQSWIWANGTWENESRTTLQVEHLQLSYWADETWQVAYDGQIETQNATASSEQRP